MKEWKERVKSVDATKRTVGQRGRQRKGEMNELRRRRGKGKTRMDYSVRKKEKKRRRKSLVVAKFRHFFRWAFFFPFLLSLSSAGGIQGPGISGRLDKKKRKKGPGHPLEQPTRVAVHPNTAQPERERLQPAMMDIGTPSLHPISICSLSSPYWLVPWLAHMTTGKPRR